ncbi:unnamed protein product [Musa acuminata subsp. burmannicoides]
MTGTYVDVLRNQPVATGAPAATNCPSHNRSRRRYAALGDAASGEGNCWPSSEGPRGACCQPGEDGSVLLPTVALRGVVNGDGTEGKKNKSKQVEGRRVRTRKKNCEK